MQIKNFMYASESVIKYEQYVPNPTFTVEIISQFLCPFIVTLKISFSLERTNVSFDRKYSKGVIFA